MIIEKIKKATRKKSKKAKLIEGHVDGWNGANLWGWAVKRNIIEPVELEIIINGKKRKEIIANQFRQDLKDAGKAINGEAGFLVELNVHNFLNDFNFESENIIDIIDKSNGERLIGSPITVKKTKIRGHVDQLNLQGMTGWVINDSYPEAPVCFDLYINKKLKQTFKADQYRQDLTDSGFNNANCGFSIDVSPFIAKDTFSKVELKLAGTDENIISKEWVIEPISTKVNALTKLQNIIRKETFANGLDPKLVWLNSKVVPALLSKLRNEGELFFDNASDSPIAGIEKQHKKCIDIIIPVYKGYEETINCIKSVQRAIVKQPYELIVINDKSPDTELTKELRTMSRTGSFKLMENKENKGFVGTVNRGMRLHPERDVLLLNSDTLTPDHWLDRIVDAAYSDETVGTVTPFSNNATICSFPRFCIDNRMTQGLKLNEISELFASENEGLKVDLPTAHGFCMFIKRNVLKEIGYFDEQKWGKGYAEENDFSLRAASRGWRNILAGNAFVQHLGSVSFAENAETFIAKNLQMLNSIYPDYPLNVESFIRKDPIRPLRNNVSMSLLKKEINETVGNKKTRGKGILFISLSFGGGTKVATDDLASLLEKEGQCALMLTSPEPGLWELSSHKTNAVIQYKWPQEKQKMLNDLKSLDIWHIHFHHTVQFPKEIWDLPSWLGIDYDVTLHDYYTVCPRVNLIDDTKSYCGEPPVGGCEQCIEQNGVYESSLIRLKDVGGTVEGWRLHHNNVLQRARKVITPSKDTKKRINSHFALKNIEAKYHPEPESTSNPINFDKTDIINVAFIGAIGEHKGFNKLYQCAKHALRFELPLHFTVIGYTCNDELLKELPNVTITGKYKRDELPNLIRSHGCHISALFSVWPETFSYTLSESYKLGLLPIAYDIGAISERISNNNIGITIDLDSSASKICDYLINSRPVTKKIKTGFIYESLINNYYSF
ncbi:MULTISPECIES: glycosyltransferase [unclassified Endozoicomonas]|uniref:glycosyltransferase n=1 Tax=unclassified Endozoicomonas TaxID=2644528 RepID=UPI003BB4EB9B